MKAEDLFKVEDKVVIVTGGANGIGFAYARAMADNGAEVILFDANEAELHQAIDALKPGNVRGEVVDVTDWDAVDAACQRVVDQSGTIDVLFANAGIPAGPGFLDSEGQRVAEGAIENIPDALWQQVLDVNLSGVYAAVRGVLPVMKARRQGRVIVTTSAAASITSPAIGTPYIASKASLAHFVEQLAVELAPYAVTVNAIQPGPFRTRLTTPELGAVFEAAQPTHRIGELHELEGVALFLASGASSFVTGSHYPVDGGRTLGRAD